MGRPVDPEEEAPLLAIDAYLRRILDSLSPLTPVRAELAHAHGCVVAADVRAPMDLPPFVSSAMDGYAIIAADVAGASEAAPVTLRVAGEVRIGRPADVRVQRGTAVVVPTGGVAPPGADAVIPVELTRPDGDAVHVLREIGAGKHLRPAGEDVRAGDVVVGAGRRLFAPDIGVLAACGLRDVLVHPTPRVGVVSTGDELVPPGLQLATGQIHDSNGPTLAAIVRECGFVAVEGGRCSDEPGALTTVLDTIAPDVHALVCSGGVSMGERDPVKGAFERGGEISFANVAMQPGRPQAFGSYDGVPFFGLPGNPISVYVSFQVFVRPALLRMAGRTDAPARIQAVLSGELAAANTRSRYARVRLRRDGDRVIATPEGGHQSNLLATFARADGLVCVPAATTLTDGATCDVLLTRDYPA